MGERIFVKLYIDAIHTGMIADLGAERLQTLCTLAGFVNESGRCFPSQELLAQRMGVTKATANRRVKSLCEYRWRGKPLVRQEKTRNPKTQRWENSVYCLTDICPFKIFDRESVSV